MGENCCSLPKNWKFDYFQNKDDQRIRYGYAEPEDGNVKGTVVILPGYSLHAEHYTEQIKFYLERGYAVYTKDFAGHGGSDREDDNNPMDPGMRGMEHHVRDLHQFVKDVIEPKGKRPLIMSAHSMGGHVGLHYLRVHPGHFDMAVMAAPMFDFFAPHSSLRWIFKKTAAVMTKLGLGHKRLPRLENPRQWFREKFMKVSERLRSFNADVKVEIDNNTVSCGALEDLKLGDPTWGWVHATNRSIAALNDAMYLQKVDKIPILIAGADKEDIVCNAAMVRATSHMGRDANYIEVKCAEHGLWYSGDHGSKYFQRKVDEFIETNRRAYHGVGNLRKKMSEVFQHLSSRERYEVREAHERQLKRRGYNPPPAFKRGRQLPLRRKNKTQKPKAPTP